MTERTRKNGGVTVYLILLAFVIYFAILDFLVFKNIWEFLKLWIFIGIFLLVLTSILLITLKSRQEVPEEKEAVSVIPVSGKRDPYLSFQRVILLAEFIIIAVLIAILILKQKGFIIKL